jgi:hypothetical protein
MSGKRGKTLRLNIRFIWVGTAVTSAGPAL